MHCWPFIQLFEHRGMLNWDQSAAVTRREASDCHTLLLIVEGNYSEAFNVLSPAALAISAQR
jgi:hypothetical protein